MKYLFIILAIIMIITTATFLFIFPDQPKEKKDILVTINGHDISHGDIQEEGTTGSHHENTTDFLNSVITRRLLIVEAQKHSIDKELSFRKELKEYYEQSLIKILMERKNGTLHSARFEDLSENLQLILASLKPREMAMEFETGNENSAVLLDKIEGATDTSASIDPERARRILIEHKKRQQISNWINELHKNASITFQKQKD